MSPTDGDEVVDGIVFSYRGEARCRVCSAGEPGSALPHGQDVRARVDRLLVAGATYAGVVEAIAPLVEEWPEERVPHYASIRRHQRRHLGADQAAIRAIMERRAEQAGLRIALGRGQIVTRAAVLEVVRQRGLDALVDGAIVPNVRETLEAADVLDRLERQGGERLLVEELEREVGVLVDAVRGRLSAEEWQSLVEEVEEQLLDDQQSRPTRSQPDGRASEASGE
jgi:hypothetical protein